tara:strand:- start:688 stop:1911 length:1224 start_codon:yes stop_codon:yes gene_type:complete
MPERQDITNETRSYRERAEGDFPDIVPVIFRKEWDLKYGENPNQQAAIYSSQWINDRYTSPISELTNIHSVRSDSRGKGGLSLNNMLDICRGMDTSKYFHRNQAVAIMKHTIVSGFASSGNYHDRNQVSSFRLARDADLRSNFGGTAVFTKPLEMETAEAMYELKGRNPFFVDVVAAPDYNEGVIDYLERKSKNLRIGKFSGLDSLPKFREDDTRGLVSIKEMPGGMVGIQDLYLTSIRTKKDLIHRPYVEKDGSTSEIATKATPREQDDMLTAWWLNVAGTRSNGIVVVNNGVSVAMGSGQVERVGAVEQAIIKGMQKAMDREGIEYNPLMGIQGWEELTTNPFEGAVASSDAFFPFGDSIERFARVGITAVVQPYGSNRDAEVIEAANKHNMAMPATLERCFGHF